MEAKISAKNTNGSLSADKMLGNPIGGSYAGWSNADHLDVAVGLAGLVSGAYCC